MFPSRRDRAATLACVLGCSLTALSAARPAAAQAIYRDDPGRPLAGCWRADAAHSLTLSGGHIEITHVSMRGFSPLVFEGTVRFDRRSRTLAWDAPIASSFRMFSLAFGPSRAPELQAWRYDHSRASRASFGRMGHPLRVSETWTLSRCR